METREIEGSLAADPEEENGFVVVVLETRFDLIEVAAPANSTAAGELRFLREGDHVAVEVEGGGERLVAVAARPRYVRGLPGLR